MILDERHAATVEVGTAAMMRAMRLRRMFRRRALDEPVYVTPRYTERLKLRQYTREDFVDLVELHASPTVRAGLHWPERSLAESRMHLRARISYDRLEKADDFAVWAIELDDAVIGDVSAHLRSKDGMLEFELGWVLNPDYSGEGYATEAAESLVRLAFDELHLDAVTAMIDIGNWRSIKVAERLGMRRVVGRRYVLPHPDQKEPR